MGQKSVKSSVFSLLSRHYLNRNLWSTYIQPHLQEQNEDEMIYLGKAADMDIIYYGKFDVENFYEKIPEILKEMTPIWKK